MVNAVLFFIKNSLLCLTVMFLGMALWPSASAQAEAIPGFTTVTTNPYVVDDLPISVDADDAVKAREKAFEQALKTGFQVILERLYPDETARAAIPVPDTAQLGRLLQDFTTRDEKVGTKQYSATFQLRFRPNRLQKYLSSNGHPAPASPRIPHNEGGAGNATTVSATPVSQNHSDPTPGHGQNTVSPAENPSLSSPVLIIPYVQTHHGPILWSGPNLLLSTLSQMNTGLSNGMSYVTAVGDASDQQTIQESLGVRSPPSGFQALMQKYATDRALLVIGVPDAMDSTTPASKMTLMFYGASLADPVPEYLDSVVASVDNPTDPSLIYVQAARQIQSQIPGMASRVRLDAPEREARAEDVTAPEEGSVSSVSSSAQTVSSGDPSPELSQAHSVASIASASGGDTANDSAPIIPGEGPPPTVQGIASAPSVQPVPDVPLIRVRFDTMTEWNDIRTRIRSIPGVTSVQIHKLKAQEAAINIARPALDDATFRAALDTRGLDWTPDPVTGDPIMTRRKSPVGMVPSSDTTLSISNQTSTRSSVIINGQ